MEIMQIIKEIKKNHGGNFYNFEPVTFAGGYMVAIANSKEYRTEKEEEAAAYIQKIGGTFGAWIDEAGAFCFDDSENITDKAVALLKAYERKEQAIYDIERGCDIILANITPAEWLEIFREAAKVLNK